MLLEKKIDRHKIIRVCWWMFFCKTSNSWDIWRKHDTSKSSFNFKVFGTPNVENLRSERTRFNFFFWDGFHSSCVRRREKTKTRSNRTRSDATFSYQASFSKVLVRPWNGPNFGTLNVTLNASQKLDNGF
jgi:hypothetical protein